MKRVAFVLGGMTLAVAFVLPASAGQRHANTTPAQKAEGCIRAALRQEALAIEYIKEGRLRGADIANGVIARAIADLRCAVNATRAAGALDEISAAESKAIRADLSFARGYDVGAQNNTLVPKGLIHGESNVSRAIEALESAILYKSRALAALKRATAPPPPATTAAPCAVSYPPATIASETTVSLSGCSVAFSAIAITVPVVVQEVSSYAVISAAGLTSGGCSKTGDRVLCNFPKPLDLPQGTTFLVAFAPTLKPGDRITFELTTAAAKPLKFAVVAPASPKLTAGWKVTDDKTREATTGPRTAITFNVTIGGGPFQNIIVDLPAGNPANFDATQAGTGGLRCVMGANAVDGKQSMICQPAPGSQATLPPGSYSFGAGFQSPLAPATPFIGYVTGTGVGKPIASSFSFP